MTYHGHSPFQAWLRTILVRQGLKQKRRQHRETAFDAVSNVAMTSSTKDPELELLKQRYALEFRAAFRQSLSMLSPQHRLVLRYHLAERLTAAEIGRRLGVHRVTVSRWMQSIRRRLFEETKTHLNAVFQQDADDLGTIYSLIESRTHAVVTELFGDLAPSG